MGYFPNGDSGDAYEAKYCNNCIHQDHDKGCPIWDAHILYSYELCNQKEHAGKVILDLLIPTDDERCINKQCAMFVSRDGALPGQTKMFPMTDHDILRTGKGALGFRFDAPGGLESVLEIPRQLHFVWLGSDVPAKYKRNANDFARHNPDWSVVLWTDLMVAAILGRVQNADLYEAERNMAAKADLLRYEIIHQCGGVYLDIDTLSLGPGSLDPLTHAFTTVSGAPWFNCSNAQFGFAAGSELLAYVIRNARDPRVRAQREIPARTGPTFFTTCLLSFNDWRIVAPDGAALLGKIRHLADGNWVRDQ